jgi:hypothetical protein
MTFVPGLKLGSRAICLASMTKTNSAKCTICVSIIESFILIEEQVAEGKPRSPRRDRV